MTTEPSAASRLSVPYATMQPMWFASDNTQPNRGIAFETEQQAAGFIAGLAGWSAFPDTDTRAQPLLTAISARLDNPATATVIRQPSQPIPPGAEPTEYDG